MFAQARTPTCSPATSTWRGLDVPTGELFALGRPVRRTCGGRRTSRACSQEPAPVGDIAGARCLVILGDSVTTDHISPAGSIKLGLARGQVPRRPRRRALGLQLVRRAPRQPRGDGARHVRERAAAQPDGAGLGRNVDGACSVGRGDDDLRGVDSATSRPARRSSCSPGKEYGSGSSRDWAAKGPNLLGVRAVIADSYERIHRSNLLMMGVLPLQFMPGENRRLARADRPRVVLGHAASTNGDATEVTVRARGSSKEFRARVRLDTPREREYLQHGGILPFVLRRLNSGVRVVSPPLFSSSRACPAPGRRRLRARSASD